MAVEKSPDLLPARFNRGALLYARGAFDEALQDFDHCIAVDPPQQGLRRLCGFLFDDYQVIKDKLNAAMSTLGFDGDGHG